MTSAKFVKFCKDCGLLDKKVSGTVIDLIFTKVKKKGQHSVGFEAFREGLGQVALKKGIDYTDLVDLTLKGTGPISTGTKTEAVKFYDRPQGPVSLKRAGTEPNRLISRSSAGKERNSFDGPRNSFEANPEQRPRASPRVSPHVSPRASPRVSARRNSFDASIPGQRPRSSSRTSPRHAQQQSDEDPTDGWSEGLTAPTEDDRRASAEAFEEAASEASRRASEFAAALNSCQARLKESEKVSKALEAEKGKFQLDRCVMVARIAELEIEVAKGKASSKEGTPELRPRESRSQSRRNSKEEEHPGMTLEDTCSSSQQTAHESPEKNVITAAAVASAVSSSLVPCKRLFSQLSALILRQLGAMLLLWEVDSMRVVTIAWITNFRCSIAHSESNAIATSALEAEENALEALEASQEEACELAMQLATAQKELSRLLTLRACQSTN